MRSHLAPCALLLLLSACADSRPPIWEGAAGIEASAIEARSLRVEWPAAQDDRAVAGYEILLDEERIGEADADVRSWEITGLAQGTEYIVAVTAVDEAGNRSERLSTMLSTADGQPPSWPEGAALSLTVEELEAELGAEELDPEALPPVEAGPSSSLIRLAWPPAEDRVGVTRYRIRKDGEVIATLEGHTLRHELQLETPAGVWIVEASDEAENVSRPLMREHRDPGFELAAGLAEPTAPSLAPAAVLQLDPSIVGTIPRLRLGEGFLGRALELGARPPIELNTPAPPEGPAPE
ncbi:MAG: fibronectin type III domain-containing protein [Myxococcales bacterium]|nr:fibronectin type III domain-containing protein [Myxococcales bacterium]